MAEHGPLHIGCQRHRSAFPDSADAQANPRPIVPAHSGLPEPVGTLVLIVEVTQCCNVRYSNQQAGNYAAETFAVADSAPETFQ